VHRTVLEHLPVGVGACSKQREGRLAYLWSRSLRLRFEFRECARRLREPALSVSPEL
jgi:hypothetical protein